ncbi:conserved hypothetical protein [Ricinus communis]|uniref:Transmembrane protein n=1 Tax=Ricinus communis TaxID=3988 RepID=B9SM60_RICCO|nr:conserved hypothetical protein [Ricinus communis]
MPLHRMLNKKQVVVYGGGGGGGSRLLLILLLWLDIVDGDGVDGELRWLCGNGLVVAVGGSGGDGFEK